jgi:hypothetical protein
MAACAGNYKGPENGLSSFQVRASALPLCPEQASVSISGP